MLAILLSLPLGSVFFLRKNTKALEKPHFKERFDELYAELNMRRALTTYFIGFFFLRRLLFSLVCVFLVDTPTIQIQFYILASVLNVILLIWVKPYETPHANRIEIFNELTILAVATHLPIFTDFVPSVDQQTIAGYSLIAVVLLNVLVHLIIMLGSTALIAWALSQKLRRRYCPKKHKT